ncbi:biopolymer transporter ExbD [Olleya aquimaris]|uniref:Biopolymer transporter ExbD n=1 Tax=Olleya sediminilitoris TaxID=2795739 RepID=A0ABS1WIU1_9FLAO|nr:MULTISPECIES: biopolymer transporter ExbD [Olleya]AXO81110.1 biopolymer transporter ExbD [Olleya aquimaris]MBL7559024.1 biopolymer transporter ExbD [Olleya sediminilitoris]
MSKFKKGGSKELPAISTASLPDIVFMLLFFFMVATVMRDSSLKIKNNLPSAAETEKLGQKNLIMFIYAGKPSDQYKSQGEEAKIQLNDKFANLNEIASFVAAERASKREAEIPQLIAALKVDKETNMGLVSDIEQQLRKVGQLKINYTTKKGSGLK